jgi:alpha-tubulin suppressor-like RCC1 family protein
MHWTSVSAPFGRVAQAALAALLLVSCSTDTPVGPGGRPGLATLRVRPEFTASARLVPLVMDSVQVTVVRPPSEILAVVSKHFSATAIQLSVNANLLLNDVSENLSVTIELFGSGQRLFQGTSTITVSVAGSNSVSSVNVVYVGPGSDLTSLTLSPRDTVASGGGVFPFGVTAQNIQGAPVADFYVSWTATKGSITSTGIYTAPMLPGVDTIVVRSPATSTSPLGVVDTTTVTVAAPLPVIPVAISAGGDHTCQINAGITYCWGDNADGAAGDGTNTDRYVPTPVVGGQGFVAVSAGDFHTCALTAQGAALCWGFNGSGELGDGTTTSSNTPVAVGGGKTFVQIAAGEQFTCALTAQGEAWCWGSNWVGQLGDGSINNSNVPVQVAGGHTFNRITGNGIFNRNTNHACAIDIAGAAWCWGSNTSGELGDGSLNGSLVPVAVGGGHSFVDIAAGGQATCAIGTDRVGYCWGLNFGVSLTSPTPVQGSFQFVNTGLSVVMGYSHVCGRTTTVDWVCGGDNSLGQLGDGTAPTDQSTPVRPQGNHVFSMVGAGAYHSCGITSTGTYCWGDNSLGQLGLGDLQTLEFNTPALVVGPVAGVAVSAGNNQFAAPGATLPFPPAVVVRDAANKGVPGVEVTFAVTLGGGTFIGGATTETQMTNASGVATSTGWILGPSAGTNTMTATVPGGGVIGGNPFSFTATGQIAGAGKTWVGTTGNWNLANNWNPTGIPTNADDVIIPAGTTNPPTLTNAGSAKSVTVNTGATLSVGAFTLTVSGNVFADGAITGTGSVAINAAGQLRGNVSSLILSAPVTLSGPTQVTGSVTVSGATGELIVAGTSIHLTTNLAVQGGALLTMANGNDLVSVDGNATFNGGNEFNHLIAGALYVGGNFVQVGTSGADPNSFRATGTHTTVLYGPTASVSFNTPGTATGSSGFALFNYSGTGTLTLGSDVFVQGTFSLSAGSAVTVSSSAGRLLTASSLQSNNTATTFNNVRLALVSTTPTLLGLSNVTFQSMPTTSAQLTIVNPGTATAFTFVNVAFNTTPVTPNGFYMDVTDPDGATNGVLAINMVSPTPGTPGTSGQFLKTTNATVVWPFGAGAIIWTGNAGTAWGTPGNWNPQTVPTSADNVIIPAVNTSPALTATVSVNDLTVQSGATLALGGFSINVNGNVSDAAAGITSTATGQTPAFPGLVLAGTGKTITGLYSTSLGITVKGTYSISGNAVLVGGTLSADGGGDLTIAGTNSLSVGGDLNVGFLQSGTLTMNSGTPVVVVAGNATFQGGAETGKLTAGSLQVQGNFQQVSTFSPLSFVAAGSHSTQLVGTGTLQTVGFSTPGPTQSRFANLVIAGSQTPTQFLSSATATGIFSSSGTTIRGNRIAGARLMVLGGINLTSAIVNDLPITDSATTAGTYLGISIVAFQNMDPTVAELVIKRPGDAVPYTLDQLAFTTQLNGGLYISALDLDGATPNALTINVTNSTPSSGTGVSQASGGAVINWPPVGGNAVIWNAGVNSTNWNTPGNWVGGAVPTATDSAVIVSTQFNPVLPANVSVGAVEIQSGNLDLSRFTLTVARSFVTSGTGTVSMTSPTAVLDVGGTANFDGGSTFDLLTSGTLSVAGNFVQNATTSVTSFAPTGTHLTKLGTAAIPRLLQIGSPGTGNQGSHFMILDITGSSGGIAVVVNTIVDSLLISTPGTAAGAWLIGGGASITTKQVRVGGLTLDDVPMIINENSSTTCGVAAPCLVQKFDTVSYVNFPTIAPVTQLTYIAPGGIDGRIVTFNFNNFTPIPDPPPGQGALYVSVTGTAGLGPQPNLANSNEGATRGGNGPNFSVNLGTASPTPVLWP